MAQSSFLDAIGQSILDSASSIDAHIDAGALVDRIGDSSSRARQFALAELKALAKRAPEAVVATEGAVVAILRVVEKLSPGDQEMEDANVEALQDALECLGCLMDDVTKGVKSENKHVENISSAKREKEADDTRGQLVAELVVKHSQNGKQLLRLLSAGETATQYDAMLLLQKIYRRLPEPVDSAILADPGSLGQLMHILQSSPIDYVRNESLGLLLLITESNTDIQTIVTVQGFIEAIFTLLEEEDLTAGGKVAKDLLQCLINVVGNTTCQKYLRETNGAASIVNAISLAITGRPAEEEEEEDEERLVTDSRWACLGMLVDAALLLAKTEEANRLALVRAGALELLRHLAQNLEEAQLRLVQLFEALEPCPQAAERLQTYSRSSTLFSELVALLLGPVTPLTLRNALGRVLQRCIARHSSLQSFLCSSLGPELGDEETEAKAAGRVVVELLEATALGGAHAPPEVLWFALHLLLAMMVNPSVQSACVTMPVSIPTDAGPAESFQELLFRAFSASARTVSHGEQAEGADPCAQASVLLGFLKLLLYWLANCATVLANFAMSPVMVPLAMELTQLSCGPFFSLQIQGLACSIMGTCIMESEADAASLMALISRRIGIETFQHKVESLWRSEALQRPPKQLGDFRWYSGHFRRFLRERQRSAQRRMVQLYVSEGVGGTGLSEDVAEHYKQLIRVQDAELNEVRHENEQLRSEVEAFMTRSLKASSAALADKADALEMENKALHVEVEQLQGELEHRVGQLEEERKRLRAAVQELELQLQSMAVSYGQVEQNNAELRAALARS